MSGIHPKTYKNESNSSCPSKNFPSTLGTFYNCKHFSYLQTQLNLKRTTKCHDHQSIKARKTKTTHSTTAMASVEADVVELDGTSESENEYSSSEASAEGGTLTAIGRCSENVSAEVLGLLTPSILPRFTYWEGVLRREENRQNDRDFLNDFVSDYYMYLGSSGAPSPRSSTLSPSPIPSFSPLLGTPPPFSPPRFSPPVPTPPPFSPLLGLSPPPLRLILPRLSLLLPLPLLRFLHSLLLLLRYYLLQFLRVLCFLFQMVKQMVKQTIFLMVIAPFLLLSITLMLLKQMIKQMLFPSTTHMNRPLS
jgi:hypothetical protein